VSGKTLSRIPGCILVAVVVVAACLFMAAGVEMHDFQRAWNILTGAVGPFGGRDAGLGVALAAVGYLLLPAVIALAIADGVTRFTRKHLVTLPEAKAEIGQMIATALRDQASDAQNQRSQENCEKASAANQQTSRENPDAQS
jgi:hypothetical protein